MVNKEANAKGETTWNVNLFNYKTFIKYNTFHFQQFL